MRKWIAVAVLACCASLARGQCQPTNSPTLTQSQQVFQVSDYAKTGNVTATLTVEATDSIGNPISGAKTSHNLTAGNTWITFNTSFNNAASWSSYYTVNSDPTHYPTGFNGNPHQWFLSNADNGDVWSVYVIATHANGSTTQDKVTVTAGTGTQPTIIYQDESSTNVYVNVSGIYSGNPNIPYGTTCTQAAEKPMTPTAQLQVFNLSSGETRPGVTLSGATTVVGQPVYATASDYVSALPGDTITGTFQGVTYCSAIGNVFSHLQWFRIEEARTVVKDLGHPPRVGPDGGSEYDVAPICQNNCDPPDWPVNVVDSFTGRHPYWVAVTSCLRAPDVDGAPWICAADYMYDIENTFGELDVFEMLARGIAAPYPSALPIPGKCTKYPVNVLATLGPGDIKRFFGFGNN